MIKVSFKLEGARELSKNLSTLSKRLGQGVEKGIIEAGAFLKEESNKVAPVEIGNLIDESFSTASPKAGMDTVVYVGYGPPGSVSEHYAVPQHEFPELKRKKKAGRQWKYLEEPFRRNSKTMVKMVQKSAADAIK